MDQVCRLCCSSNFVNNYIFDEETALHLKMSLYMPLKVLKDDRLPQKICNKCSCKVNDFYQFCNEAIEVQNRLVSGLLSSGISMLEDMELKPRVTITTAGINYREQATQTEAIHPVVTSIPDVQVKVEPRERSLSPIVKQDDFLETYDEPAMSSDDENLSLLKIKKKKNKKTKHKLSNGVKETKASKKSKKKVAGWDDLISALPEGTTIGVVSTSKVKSEVPKDEDSDGLGRLEEEDNLKKIKAEPSVFNCCMCSYQFYSRAEMITHYKEHADDTDFPCEPPPPPPLPDQDPVRCPRCAKMLSAATWARHWAGHWARDRRPYHCARCECSFKDPHQIFKHGLTHEEEGEAGAGAAEGEKRFICDLCPEGFVYMRYLLAHRTRAHPESVGLALALRCAVCRRSFAHTNSLRRHLRAHTGERNYLCNVCGKSLTSREHLKFHIRIHTGYKPNVCKTCGKGFVKKCNLTLHERTHSGEKPHVCSHCSKAFSQRSTLVIHERYHSGSRPYVCNLCGRGFVAKGLLSMHLKTTCI